MTVRLHTDRGELTGRTIASVVRREYGRRAIVRVSPDPNSPTYGLVVQPIETSTYAVLGAIYRVTEHN